MRRMMAMMALVMLAAAPTGATAREWTGPAAATTERGLSLTVRAAKGEFGYKEPLAFELTFKNVSEGPLALCVEKPAHFEYCIKLDAVAPGVRRDKWTTYGAAWDPKVPSVGEPPRTVAVELAPGESASFTALITASHMYLKDRWTDVKNIPPGTYSVTFPCRFETPARRGAAEPWSGSITSEPVEIVVLDTPARGAAGAAEEEGTAEAGPAELPDAVTVVDPLTMIYDAEDLRDLPRLEVLRLAGPRNGFCSGQVLATGRDASRLSFNMGPLTSKAGTIPRDRVRIRYAGKPAVEAEVNSTNKYTDPRGEGARYSNFPYYDVLYEAPPADATILPVWLTVEVPGDAEPGEYVGTLAVGATEVPVRLVVGAWRCPDPRDWIAHAGVLESPETLAMYYGVPLWSEEHWALVAKAFRFMGSLGCRDLFLTALARNHLGQENPLITFTKADGGYEPDFRLLDRYLATYVENACTPRAFIVYLWDPRQWGRRGGEGGQTVSVRSADGFVTEQLAPFGEPGSKETWKPVMDGVRERAVKLGIPDERIYLGCGTDRRPGAGTVAFFQEIAPYASWDLFTHGRADGEADGYHDHEEGGRMVMDNGMEVGYYEYPEAPRGPAGPDKALVGGWNMPFRKYVLPRDFLYLYSPLKQWRNFPEGTTVTARKGWAGHNASAAGFTRLGVDYWPVIGGPNRRSLLNRYSSWSNMYRSTGMAFTAPGPDGPLGTARFEMLREGMQELEARIAIEQALLDGEIGGGLADDCRALLQRRNEVRWKEGHFFGGQGHSYYSQEDRHWGIAPDWQDNVIRLFDLAGRVEAAGAGGPSGG